MNKLEIFKNEKFGEVRTIVENEQILFCAKDVASALGYDQPLKAIDRHCKKGRVCFVPHPQSPDKTIEIKFIPESDVYRLIIKSKLPQAEQFEIWVFDEVLPSIRKHGGYLTPQKIEEVLLNPDTLIQLAQNLKQEQEKNKLLNEQLNKQAPKVLFAESVEASKTTILIGELAKILKQNGLEDIGQNKLFEKLRQEGYLIKNGSSQNMPTQRSMNLGLFEIKESVHSNPDGSIRVNKTTKVTGKGQVYFINKYCTRKKEAILW